MNTCFATYSCISCRKEPTDDCTDTCAVDFVHELPPLWSDEWPACPCCGRPAHLVAPLIAFEEHLSSYLKAG